MELQRKRIFFYCLSALAVCCFLIGHTAAALAPDKEIETDLKSLFEDPPPVKGYPYQDYLAQAAARYNLPLPYVLAVARGESFFDPGAESVKGALGIMQVMPATAEDYGVTKKELLEPKKNIDVGVHYLADLYRKFEDPYLALAAYYCGCNGMKGDRSALRKDCREYVRYIHSHLRTILARPGEGDKNAGHRFVLTRFDTYLAADSFLAFLSEKVPDLRLDLFQKKVMLSDHGRFEYRILATVKTEEEKERVCRRIYEKTGFLFCR